MARTAWGLDTPRDVNRWEDRALCQGLDPRMWDVRTSLLTAANREAVAICRRCPVEAECLEQAVRDGVDSGIRGGEVMPYRPGVSLVLVPHGTSGALYRHRKAGEPACEDCRRYERDRARARRGKAVL